MKDGKDLSEPSIQDPSQLAEIKVPEPGAGNVGPKVDLPPLQAAGVHLAKLLLAILTGATVLLVGYLGIMEAWYSFGGPNSCHELLPDLRRSDAGDQTARVATEFVECLKASNEARHQLRTDWILIAQLVLLNLLLPLITGLFGYVFGTQQAAGHRDDT